MKKLIEYVCEDAANESRLGKKIDSIFKNNQNKLNQIIQSRQDHWDADKNDWSREPMFLVAGAKGALETTGREYSWVRWKYMRGHKDDVQGTFKNYNINDAEGNKPNSVIGIFYDRHFELITSKAVFDKIYDLLDSDYSKYYNNLYEGTE